MVSVPRPRIVSRSTDLEVEDLPEQVTIGLRELVGAAKEGLLALSVGVGLAVVQELFEAEVTRLAGPKGKHDPDRRAYRHGQEDRQVTLGGRRVQVSKPRVRSVADQEIELRTFRAFAKRDLLNQAALGRMLAGLSTRPYPVGLEPIGQVEARATSKSAISQRFVEGTERKLAELFGRDLSQLNLVAMFIDGVEIAQHCIVVALRSTALRPPTSDGSAISAFGMSKTSRSTNTAACTTTGRAAPRRLENAGYRLAVRGRSGPDVESFHDANLIHSESGPSRVRSGA